MAGKAKERDFSPYVYTDPNTKQTVTSDTLGVAKYEVKLPNGSTDFAEIAGPTTFENMLAFLGSPLATEKDKVQAFTFLWRGKEAMAAQKVRLANDTVVTIPGTSKSLDLMEIPVPVACQAINAHDLGIKVLSAASAKLAEENEEDEEEMDEDTEKMARKNRAWDNAKRFLLASGKAIIGPDDSLVPAVAGASDADDILSILSGVGSTRRKRK